ncbi:hypothetical protein [Paenibacillus eucommiae]|uniref:Uncharacterized protein YxjI n=1 Tax=Paenibacillus eucommiae TaxID=1355755 RepID=A0ABS4IY19_9BACL|nr:hypothetical protein [Paenibacillus eucommiae]MBP1992484.1 uncharacterized protein YxjI [Paenibacillus eucommiae]
MKQQSVWFRDNFFSSGTTEIWDQEEQVVGQLDLMSMFNSGIQVKDAQGHVEVIGKFRLFSNKWIVMSGNGTEIGLLSARLAFLSKKYEYESYRHGLFEIRSEAFSNEYEIQDSRGQAAASFTKVSGFGVARAYRLHNHTNVPTEEWIAVVMGVHAIQKRRRSSSS